MTAFLCIWLAMGLCSYGLLLRGWYRERVLHRVMWPLHVFAFVWFVATGPIMGLAWIGEECDL